MKDLNEIISNNITKLRKNAKMTLNDLAKKINYSNKMVSKWENGDIVPSIEVLIKISEVFKISLDALINPIDNEKIIKHEEKQSSNKLIISLLAIIPVWIIATIIYVYADLVNFNAWMAFVWAIPLSCIVGIVFNSLWGKRKFNYVIISILIWSLLTCIYLQLIQYNFFPLYFIGIPLQISVILWSKLKIKNKKKEE